MAQKDTDNILWDMKVYFKLLFFSSKVAHTFGTQNERNILGSIAIVTSTALMETQYHLQYIYYRGTCLQWTTCPTTDEKKTDFQKKGHEFELSHQSTIIRCEKFGKSSILQTIFATFAKI